MQKKEEKIGKGMRPPTARSLDAAVASAPTPFGVSARESFFHCQ